MVSLRSTRALQRFLTTYHDCIPFIAPRIAAEDSEALFFINECIFAIPHVVRKLHRG